MNSRYISCRIRRWISVTAEDAGDNWSWGRGGKGEADAQV